MFNLFQSLLQNLNFNNVLPLFLPLFLVMLFLHTNFSSNGKKTPPSPPKLPIIGNLHQLGALTHRSLRELSNRYGKLMLLHFGFQPTLIVSSADLAQEVLKTNDIIVSNRPSSSIAKTFFYNATDMSFSPYGDYWRQIRSICVSQLLSTKKVHSLRVIREEETSLIVEKIKKSNGSVFNLREIIMSFTNDLICRASFGKKYGENNEGGGNFKKLLNNAMKLLGNKSFKDISPWLGWMDRLYKGLDCEVDRVAKGLDHILEDVVQENQIKMNKEQNNIIDTKQDNYNGKNFVEILLQAQKDKKVALQPHSIKAVIMDMFIGGTDTIYTLIEWAMIEIIRHPIVMKELKEELKKIVGGKGTKVSEDDLEKLTYLKAVVKETLRLHPPFPVMFREFSKDVKINGYDINAGTHVIINLWAIQIDQVFWKEPEEFIPERFLDNSYDFNGQNFNYIPFGAGRKICPAIGFSVIKAEFAIATLIHEFDWEIPNGNAIDITEISGLAVQTRDPPMLIATPVVSN